MARIKFGSLIVDGSGNLGGHTVQKSFGGSQLRTKPKHKRKPTMQQSLIRSLNQRLQAGWRALSDEQRKTWDDYAITHSVLTKRSPHVPLSGHSLWLKFQFPYLRVGLEMQPDVFIASAGPLGEELCPNPSFSDNCAGWIVSGETYKKENSMVLYSSLGGLSFFRTADILSPGAGYIFQCSCICNQNQYCSSGTGLNEYLLPVSGTYFFNWDYDYPQFYIKRKYAIPVLIEFTYCSIKKIL